MTSQPVDEGTADAARGGGLRPLIALGLLVFLLHAAVSGLHLMSPDGELLYRMTEGIALRGTTKVMPLESDPVTGKLPYGMPPQMAFATRYDGSSGSFYAQYLPLQPLLAAPLVWMGEAAHGIFSAPLARTMWPSMATQYLTGLDDVAYGRGLLRRAMVVLFFNPLVAALSAVMLARLGRLLTGSRRAGILAGALWAFGTMAWPHSRTFFTEPLAGLLAFAAFDQLTRWTLADAPRRMRHAILAGILLGLANWTRVDSPFFTVGLVAAMVGLGAWRALRDNAYARTKSKLPIADVLLCGGIAFGAWLLLQGFNAMRYGVDLTSGYSDQSESVKFATPILIGLHGLFCSPGKGLFFFSPALLAGIWGWWTAPGGMRWLGRVALIVYTPFFIAMAMWQNWDGGWCWGPRHVEQIHLPIMLGSVFLFARPLGFIRRISLIVLAVVSASIQVYGSSQDPLSYYREYFLTYDDGAYHRVNLTPMQSANINGVFRLHLLKTNGVESAPIDPGFFPAPMIDSLYLPQHTQWASYRAMWQSGFCDLFLVNLFRDRESIPNLWSENP